jgi:prefoldin subunit 5
MFDKIKKRMDDAFHGMKNGASRMTLLTEEKAKITRIQMKVNSLKKDMDKVLVKLGNRFYSLREEHATNDIYKDDIVAEILKEADNFQADVHELEEEINRIREEYEGRIKSTSSAEEEQEEEKEETKEAV